MGEKFGRLALHTWTIDTTPLKTALDAAKQGGFDAVELRRTDFKRCFDAGMSNGEVLDLIRASGIPVGVMGVEYGWLFATGEESERLFKVFRECCENAVALGCKMLMSAPGQVQGPIKAAIDYLKRAGDIAAEYDLRLAIEFNSQHDVLNSRRPTDRLAPGKGIVQWREMLGLGQFRAQGRQSRQVGRAATAADLDRRTRGDRMSGQDLRRRRLCAPPCRRQLQSGVRFKNRPMGIEGALPDCLQPRGGLLGRNEALHLRRIHRTEPMPAFQVLRLRHRDRSMAAPIAGLARPRGAISAIELDGKIHLLGGRDVRSVEWHEIYDPATDKYTFLAGMRGSTGTQPFVGQRDHMGVVVVDGKIHAIAGRMDSYDFNTSLNAVYDPKTDGWSFRAPLPTARSGVSAVYINGKIVVFGGEATGKVFGTNEAYDPKTDSWEALTPMAVPRHGLHGATAAVIGNMVHVPGGGPVPGGSVQGAYHDAFTFC